MLSSPKWRTAILVVAFLTALPLLASAVEVPWHFTASFTSGFNGWMSYPLSQDIGYDPTLFTDSAGGGTALVRQVAAHGERELAIGVIRPLQFHADRAARLHLEYLLRLQAPLVRWTITLAARDGRRYSVPLPATPGIHVADLNGAQFGLPAAGAEIQAIVFEGWLEHPAVHSTHRFELRQFVLQAQRPPAVRILQPALASAPDGRLVAEGAVRSEAGHGILHLIIAASASPIHVALTSADGRRGPEQNFAGTYSRPVDLPIALGGNPTPGLWTADISSGPAHSRFFFLVLGATPAHPRLLLSPARMAQLTTAPAYAAFRAQVHQQAQAHSARLAFNPEAGHNIASMPTGIGIGPAYPSELVPYFSLLDGYADAIADSALDYRLNHDASALAAARRGLLTVAQWETWTPPRFSHHGMHTYYEVGLFAQRVAFGYDLVAEALTAAERAAIAGALWDKAVYPTAEEYFLHNRMPLAASNWMANSLGGALAAAVATAGDIGGDRQREDAALAELTAAFQQNLAGLFPGDGSEVEPAGYENFAMKGIAWGMSALQALGIRPVGTQAMLDGFWWPDYAMVRPDLVLDTGDFDGELKAVPGFAWGAEYGGDPALRAFYDRVTKPLALPPAMRLQDTGRRLEDMPGLLNLICCTHPAGHFDTPPPARIFKTRGSAVLRSGWDENSTVISLRAGPWFNHEHHDQGSFQVAALGDGLIADAGYADYYRDPNYPTYFTQATGHNTVIVDDNAFSQVETQGRFWTALSDTPRFTTHVFASQFDYLAADLAPAYRGRVSAYRRQYLFLPPGVLLVRDQLQAPEPHTFSWLLHAAPGIEPDIQGRRAELRAAHAEATITAEGSGPAWASHATPVAINAFRDLDRGVIASRYEMRLNSPKARDASFLVAMQFGPRDVPAPTLSSIATTAGSGVAAADGQWTAMFRTAPGALTAGSLSTDGNVLARRGDGWMVSGATWVRDHQHRMLVSSQPLDLAYRPISRGVRLDTHARAPFDLWFRLAAAPATVELDGHPASFTIRDDGIALKNIPQGDHRVWITGKQLP